MPHAVYHACTKLAYQLHGCENLVHYFNFPMASLPKPQRGPGDEGIQGQSSLDQNRPGPELVPRDRMMLLGLEASQLPMSGEAGEETGWAAARTSLTEWATGLPKRLGLTEGQRLHSWLSFIARWWLNADFRGVQLPIFAAAAMLWIFTAWMAWRSEEPLRIPPPRAQVNVTTTPAAHAQVVPEPGKTDTSQDDSDSALRSFMQRLAAAFFPEPEVQAPQGDPRVKVWVDKRTGLYYCPGDEHPLGHDRGKTMTQREAELDYYRPAYNAPCF
jgi:hypothetical protein